tara:strand:- start:1222 stop:2310 length:1089 start_codon:yes stop_codon:yes gene_type:complete
MMRPMKTFIKSIVHAPILLLLLCLGASPQAFALIVDGLYDQEIAVQGQGDAERIRAYREGMTAVILKITGEERWLRNSAVERAIRDAQSYVQEVSYRTSSGSLDQRSFINVRFDRALVDRMLNDAGIPVWDQNRPAVMLWLSVQGADGRRELLSADTDHPLLDIVKEFSRLRGIPLLFPLLDLEDRRNLPTDVAWSLNEQAIRAASARYGADAILSGRILESPNGELVGLWQFLFRDNVESFDSFERDLKVYAEGALERVTAQISTHFGLIKLAQPVQVKLRVDAVDSAKDYVDLLQYIQGLAVVESASASLLDGSGIEIDVSLIGNPFLFGEFITLGRDLQEQESFVAQERENVFYYRWVR